MTSDSSTDRSADRVAQGAEESGNPDGPSAQRRDPGDADRASGGGTGETSWIAADGRSQALDAAAVTKALRGAATAPWGPAVHLAARALGLLVAAGAAVTLIGFLGQVVAGGRPSVLGTILAPVVMVLAWMGAIEGGLLVATGMLYLGVAYHRSSTSSGPPADAGMEWFAARLALGAKAGVVGAGLVFLVAGAIYTVDRGLVFQTSAPVSGNSLRLLWLLVPGVGVHVLVAVLAVAARSGVRLDEIVLVSGEWLAVGRSATRGAARVLLVGVGGALVVAVALQVYWSLAGAPGGAGLLSRLLWTVSQLASAWVDIAAQTAVHALRFVQGAAVGWMVSPEWGSAWIWVTVPILAGGYVTAGFDVASRSGNRDDAIRASLLVGPVVGVLLALGMIGRVGLTGAVPLLVAALVLSSFWGGLTLAAGLVQRNRHPNGGQAIRTWLPARDTTTPSAPGWIPTPALAFPEAIGRVLRGSLDFQGRARRSEFWWWMLFTVPFTGVVALSSSPVLISVLSLLFLLPHSAVSVRRLHDLGRSGAWLLGLFALLVGPSLLALLVLSGGAFGAGLAVLLVGEIVGGVAALAFLVAMALPGRPGSNVYGPSPAHRWHTGEEMP